MQEQILQMMELLQQMSASLVQTSEVMMHMQNKLTELEKRIILLEN